MRLSLFLSLALAACTAPSNGGSDTSAPPVKDADGDGSPADVDCDDDDEAIHPDATELCNGVDDDCDGATDEDVMPSWWPDADGDGWGDEGGTATQACTQPAGTVGNARDCDDADADVWPGHAEECNGQDDDCDGEADEGLGDPVTVWPDADGDGAGDRNATPTTTCAETTTGVTNDYDCDDTNSKTPTFVDATAGGHDGTLASPYPSVQQGIDRSSGCVVVFPGTYDEDLHTSGKSVELASTDGADSTILVGTGSDAVLTVEGGETVSLKGFTITNGTGKAYVSSSTDGTYTYYYTTADGGGAYVSDSTLELDHVVFVDNTVYEYHSSYDGYSTYYYYYGYGGNLYAIYSTITGTDVTFQYGDAYYGGAVYAGSSVLNLTRVSVLDNQANYYAGIEADYSTVTLTNLWADANDDSGNQGAIAAYGGTMTLRNGTLVDNDVQVSLTADAVLTIDSCTLQGGLYGIYSQDGTTPTVQYSNVYGHTAANYYGTDDKTGFLGNISVNSGFAGFVNDGDSTDDDLALQTSSSLVDAGNPNASYDDGDGTRNDMGMFGGPNGSW